MSVFPCSSTFLSSWNPWYTCVFVMEPPLTTIKENKLLVRKSNFSLLDTSINKLLLQKLKSNKFMTWLFLHFWNVSTKFRIWQREPLSKIYVVPFSNFGNWITYGLLRIRCLLHLNYIAHYCPYLHCCYYFASHKKICYFASSRLTK